jgi:hypothetical protein
MSDTAVQVARPPRTWELATLALIVCVFVAGVLGLVFVALEVVIAHSLETGGIERLAPSIVWMVDHLETIDGLYFAVVIGYLVGFFVWRNHTRTMLADRGYQLSLAHWTVLAWQISVGATFVIRLALLNVDLSLGVVEALWIEAALTSARVSGITLLLIGLFTLRETVREAVATQIAHSSDERPSALPDRPAPARAQTRVSADAFWEQARRTASGSRADLALLETSATGEHRWLLVPGDGSPVRGAVSPSATLTLFPTPPEADETKGFRPTPADAYHGFLEDKTTGALVYESVPARKVGAFLGRARSARRWALYRPDDPAAVVAAD